MEKIKSYVNHVMKKQHGNKNEITKNIFTNFA